MISRRDILILLFATENHLISLSDRSIAVTMDISSSQSQIPLGM